MSIATDKSIPTYGEVRKEFELDFELGVLECPIKLDKVGVTTYSSWNYIMGISGHRPTVPILFEMMIGPRGVIIDKYKPVFVGNMYHIISGILTPCFGSSHSGVLRYLPYPANALMLSMETTDYQYSTTASIYDIRVSWDIGKTKFNIKFDDADMVGEDTGYFAAYIVQYQPALSYDYSDY